MRKPKYKFNPESLSFDKIRLGVRDILLRTLAILIGTVIVAVVFNLLYGIFFDTPKEKSLKREIEQLSLQYDIVHREMANLEKVIEHLQETDDNLYRTIFGQNPSSPPRGRAGSEALTGMMSLRVTTIQSWLSRLPGVSTASERRYMSSQNRSTS